MSYDGTIEVGRFYRTENGSKVRIYATDGSEAYPIHGANLFGGEWRFRAWLKGGRCGDGFDIVGLWVDPPEPKWRPFTAEELTRIVGRRVRHKETGKVFLLVGYADNHVEVGWFKLFPQQLFEQWQFLDFDSDGNEVTTPCGVLKDQS